METDAKQTGQKFDNAVVMGAGIAGLFTARIFSDFFKKVTLIDKDDLPNEALSRKGAAQGDHVHILLKQGQMILSRLFPGIDAELEKFNIPRVNWASESVWYNRFGASSPYLSQIETHSCSRILLEFIMRRFVTRIPNLQILSKTEAVGLYSINMGKTITGVQVKTSEGKEFTLESDLLVDACGRNSPLPHFLKSLGFGSPETISVESNLGYAGRLLKKPKNNPFAWKQVYVQLAPPENQRGGILIPIENDLWLVNLIGAGSDRPPVEEKAYLEFAKSLRKPDIYQAFVDF